MKLRILFAIPTGLLLLAIYVTATLRSNAATNSSPPPPSPISFDPKDHPYHKHPPKQELPNTLDPEPFRDAPEAYVAYALAGKIRSLLYQQPCMCACGRQRGHKSLLDCFTSIHGRNCGECKLEVFYCYEQSKKGWSARKIRKGMFAFQFLRIDFDAYAAAKWRELTGSR